MSIYKDALANLSVTFDEMGMSPSAPQGKEINHLKDVDPYSFAILKEACEKAERYDDMWGKLAERHLSLDAEVEACEEAITKQNTAKEIIDMIDAMCVDENADVIWQSGAYIRNKYIAQKIRERYRIKEMEK